MQEWFTANKLAHFVLQGLPCSEPAIRAKAKKENWVARSNQGPAKGYEYHYSSLPEVARIDYLRQMKEQLSGQASVAVAQDRRSIKTVEVLCSEQVDAKLMIVRFFERWHKASGLSKTKARKTFVELYQQRELGLENTLYEQVTHFSLRTLMNWEKLLHERGAAALKSNRGVVNKGTGLLSKDKEVQEVILGMLLETPHVSAKVIMRVLRAQFVEARLPSYRTVQRFLKNWKEDNAQLLERMTDPDAWRSKYMAAAGSASESVVRLNQLWEFDSTVADVMLADGKRHAIIGVIDVYSRRVKFLVSRTSKAAGIAAVMRKAILDWGVPEIAKTDNGADYVSRHMQRVFAHLDIQHEVCPPFSPQKKPHVERVFKTFLHDFFELLPGFVGHSVMERQKIENRKSFSERLMKKGKDAESEQVHLEGLTSVQLQDFCDSWAEAVYAQEKHGSLGCTPFQQAASYKGLLNRIENEDALNMLLMEAAGDGTRIIVKKGIRIENDWFNHVHLGGMEGKRVKVFLDDADWGHCWVYSMAGEFLCKAISPERQGISPKEIAKARRHHQTKVLAEQRKELSAARRSVTAQDLVRSIQEKAVEEAEKVTAFPQKSERHITKELEEAAKAAEVKAGKTQGRVLSEEEQAQHEQLKQEMAQQKQEKVVRFPVEETARGRFKKAWRIERRLKRGEVIEPEDLLWLGAYQATEEYAAEKSVCDDFGAASLGLE